MKTKPTKTKQVSVHMPTTLHSKVKRTAKVERRSVSAQIVDDLHYLYVTQTSPTAKPLPFDSKPTELT
jgi:hypothetical protein